MKSSCIRDPKGAQYIRLYRWQIEACEGNHCAALLLGIFRGWHDAKILMSDQARHLNAVRERHGEAGTENESTLQWHTADQLVGYMFGLYQKAPIREAIDLLVRLGFLDVRRNPNPRLAFDATKFYMLNPESINRWVSEHYPDSDGSSDGTRDPMCTKSSHRSEEIARPSEEIARSLDHNSSLMNQKTCDPADREPAKTSASRVRPRNLAWEELAKLDGWDGVTPTPSSWSSRVGKAVKDLRDHHPKFTDQQLALEIAKRAKAYREEWPDCELTSMALVKHWLRFAQSPQPTSGEDGPTLIFQADPSERTTPEDAEAKRKRFGAILKRVGLNLPSCQ